eukprot:490728-Pleurochrysis_carterae.AAC.1
MERELRTEPLVARSWREFEQGKGRASERKQAQVHRHALLRGSSGVHVQETRRISPQARDNEHSPGIAGVKATTT